MVDFSIVPGTTQALVSIGDLCSMCMSIQMSSRDFKWTHQHASIHFFQMRNPAISAAFQDSIVNQ